MLEDRKADFLPPLKLEALIIPSPKTLPMFHQDCDRVGLRRRRQYDSRRTFISLSQAGPGAERYPPLGDARGDRRYRGPLHDAALGRLSAPRLRS